MFPDLGGDTTNTTLSAPISLNVTRGRSIQNFTVNLTHSTSQTTNVFANNQNVAGIAGIQYPTSASTDPLNWGVPNLSFSGFTGVRGASASQRTDNRLTSGYTWIHPLGAINCGSAATTGSICPSRDQLQRARQFHLHRSVLVGRHDAARPDRRGLR